MARIEPAVTQLMFDIPNGSSYIDLAKSLSKVNRRLYRQGYTYVIQDIQMHSLVGIKNSDITLLEFHTMGNSWVVHNAWKKSYQAWRRQQNDAKRALGSDVEGAWADYKIFLDVAHRAGTIVEPLDGGGQVYLAGEWLASQFVWDDAETARETYAHMLGANVGTTDFGLIENYGDARRSVPGEDPVIGGDMAETMYSKMFAYADEELTDMIVDNLEAKNDAPPYDHDDYPGGAANADHAVLCRILSCTGGQGSAMVPGFIVPCGLLRVENSEIIQNGDFLQDATIVTADAASATARIVITLAPGPYRGVLASPMGQ